MRLLMASVLLCLFGSSTLAQAVPAPSEAVPEGLSTGDWSSIREAYEAGRHAAQPQDGGYRARNPGQQWSTVFDGRGFTTTPDAGGWRWGLQLASYGWGETCNAAELPASVHADGPHISYEWDDVLTEWYVNDGRGLEHGYTLNARPADAAGPLTLALAIRGGLKPVVSADGRDVRFVDEQGGAALTYAGLTVLDADGRSMPAGWQARGGGLLLQVDDQGARYPLTIDPVAQQAYLKASNTGAGDLFGLNVAVSGDTVVVAARGEASSATGVDGNQTDNSAPEAGAAYVFVRSGTIWSQQAYLKASNTEAYDGFGSSVSVSGDTIVVGAWDEDSGDTGVDGNQDSNSADGSGAAYVFVRSGTTWSQQAYLKAPNTGANDEFGGSVSVSGDTVVVGAHGEDSSATGVDGDGTDNSGLWAGAAYVFVRSGTTWSQQAYLKASNTDTGDQFGSSVSASGDTIVVGADGEESSATGVDGDGTDNSANQAGAAYVFVRNGTTWTQQAYLKASNTEAYSGFGSSVSVSGDTAVVGADSEDSSATGVNGDQSNNSAGIAGAAYVFVRSGTAWSQQAYLKASNTGSADEFGHSISVSGDTIVVGAWREDSSATGVDGDGTDNSADGAGAAYVFVRSGTTWSQQAYLKASNTGADDHFGWSVSVSGDTVVVGAYGEDSAATGADGDQINNGASGAGAAYVSDLAAPTLDAWTDQVSALAGVSGDPLLEGSGTLEANTTNHVDLTNAAPSALAGLLIALSSTPTPFKGGTIKPGPLLIGPQVFVTSPAGEKLLQFALPLGAPPATELWLQWAIQDAAAIHGVALSNAIVGLTP